MQADGALAEFLLARIAEVEERARACAAVYPSPWELTDRGHSARVRGDEPNFLTVAELDQDQAPGVAWLSDALTHVAYWDPAHVLAECVAKRRIVEVAVPLSEHSDFGSATDDEGWAILYALALPYADHPDYREEWKP